MCARRTNADRSRTTRARVVAVARDLFAVQGYAATSLAEVAAGAAVSTGALYHHWAGKEALLAAVVNDVHADLAREIAEPGAAPDPLVALEHAATVFLRRCGEPDVGRVLLREAPAVLGEAWHELDRRWWQRPTAELLRRAGELGLIDCPDPDGYATALLGSLTALGRDVAAGGDPAGAGAVFHALLAGVRLSSPGTAG